MTKRDRLPAATIATWEPRAEAIVGTVFVCLIAGLGVQHGPHWVTHAPRPVIVAYLVVLAAVLTWGCLRGWRIGLRVDRDGVTVRNFFRTHRFALAEVGCFTDGSSRGGESRHWWALCVVLRDGRAVTARGTTRSGPPGEKTLTAIRKAADRYQIPAELTGASSERGLPRAHGPYVDPAGQAGWQHAASQARRISVVFGTLVAGTVLLLAAALLVELWGHGHHKNYDPGFLLFLALICAFFAFCAWPAVKRYRKLDRGFRGSPRRSGVPQGAEGRVDLDGEGTGHG